MNSYQDGAVRAVVTPAPLAPQTFELSESETLLSLFWATHYAAVRAGSPAWPEDSLRLDEVERLDSRRYPFENLDPFQPGMEAWRRDVVVGGWCVPNVPLHRAASFIPRA